jgi:hypothetical protein
MPQKHRVYTHGERVNVWIPKRHIKLWNELENKSAFVQIALDDAIGIMTWALLRKRNPEKYKRPIDSHKVEEVMPTFNEEFPLDPLTNKRLGKEQTQTWPKNSVKKPELW